jgi:hypothetical protein
VPAAEPIAGQRLPCAVAACVAATVAFSAYATTLLPGVDLGDTGGLQAAALWREATAREAYPLYFALGELFVRAVSPADPARGLNLFSAVCGAMAVGLLTFLAGRIARSAMAGAAAGVLLAFSHTFWTQAIIAEVYTLHLTLIGACLLALAAFASRPTVRRLVVFFGAYAVSFGNHLSMILLLAPFAVFLLQTHPRPRVLFQPRIVVAALLVAAVGALAYTGNFLSVWTSVDARPAWNDRLATFWFETTKADWREAMVLGIPSQRVADRLAMWWWDARQQFGIAGLALAIVGALRLWTIARPWAVLALLAYAASAAFALTYNVGDVHAFFLPAHFFTAFTIAAAASPLERRKSSTLLATLVLLYAGWRGWDTWPAVDRHADRRAEQLVVRVTQGVDDRNGILLSQMNWQAENALLYASRHDRRSVAWTRLADVLPHLPFLVADNRAIGRDIVLTSEAAGAVVAAYGPLFPIVPDDVVPVLPFDEVASRIPAGVPFVLTLLAPLPEEPFDPAQFEAMLRALTAGQAPGRSSGPYEVWAGVTGEAPALYRAAPRPFRASVPLRGDRFSVRMESWLPADTFRRAGFGRVLRGREPVLAIERGVSLVWFQPDGSPVTVYAAGLYAQKPRFRIPAPTATLVTATPPQRKLNHATSRIRPSPTRTAARLAGSDQADSRGDRARAAAAIPEHQRLLGRLQPDVPRRRPAGSNSRGRHRRREEARALPLGVRETRSEGIRVGRHDRPFLPPGGQAGPRQPGATGRPGDDTGSLPGWKG